MSLETGGGLEEHDPALLNRHLDARLGIATDALTLAAHDEIAKAGELHVLARNEGVRYLP